MGLLILYRDLDFLEMQVGSLGDLEEAERPGPCQDVKNLQFNPGEAMKFLDLSKASRALGPFSQSAKGIAMFLDQISLKLCFQVYASQCNPKRSSSWSRWRSQEKCDAYSATFTLNSSCWEDVISRKEPMALAN